MCALKANTLPPDSDDPVCLASYLIAGTRVGGGPEERSGFWPAYWEALEFNEKTDYKNNRLQICAPLIRQLLLRNPGIDDEPIYYRQGRLTKEDDRPLREI